MIDVVVLLIAVAGSALCSYLTAALQHMPTSVVTTMADEGSRVAKRLRRTADKPDETNLAITMADAMFLILATASLASLTLGYDNPMRFAIEALVLVLALAASKTVAAVVGSRYVERFLRGTGNMLAVVNLVALPITAMHRVLMRITKHASEEEEAREELEALVETAREEGALDAGEYRIMTNIMQLSSIEVGDVMTPRTVVFNISEETEVADAIKCPELQMYSRFPIIDGPNLDAVSGYVMTKDVLRAAVAGRQSTPLSKLKRPVDFIPENVTLEKALEQFLQKRQHLFMVVDEYGGVEGLLSMEDVMETVLGVEIVDEADHVVDLRALAKQRRDQRVAINQQEATIEGPL